MNMFADGRWPTIALAAKAAGATTHQVYRWKTQRKIPGSWHLKLMQSCERRGIRLTRGELLKAQSNGRWFL